MKNIILFLFIFVASKAYCDSVYSSETAAIAVQESTWQGTAQSTLGSSSTRVYFKKPKGSDAQLTYLFNSKNASFGPLKQYFTSLFTPSIKGCETVDPNPPGRLLYFDPSSFSGDEAHWSMSGESHVFRCRFKKGRPELVYFTARIKKFELSTENRKRVLTITLAGKVLDLKISINYRLLEVTGVKDPVSWVKVAP